VGVFYSAHFNTQVLGINVDRYVFGVEHLFQLGGYLFG
jgi:hypothetical protein